MSSSEATFTRTELRFRSGEDECAAVFVRPDTTEAVPTVVLGHGFGAVKEGGPIRSAERFAAEGYAGFAFDYRHFGESGGEPRQLIDIKRQHEDWRSAIAFARSLDGVDPERIALWGSSFSGGHVLEIAASDPRIKAVISQAPFIDGLATLKTLGPAAAARMTGSALADLASDALGRGPRTMPLVGPPGSNAAMTSPDADPGYRSIYDDGFEWQNEFVSRVALRLGLYRPGQRARDLHCPLLVQVCSDDAITPPGPAIDAAGQAPKGELAVYAGLQPLRHLSRRAHSSAQ